MATAVNLISCGNLALPRELDVLVNVSKPQTDRVTDLSSMVWIQHGGTFEHGANRVAFYATIDGVNGDARVTAEGKKAARDFFAQTQRPKFLAIAQVFTTPQTGFMRTGQTALPASLAAVANGSFQIAVDGISKAVTAVDLTGITTMAGLATVLQTAIRTPAVSPFSTVTVTADAVTRQLTIKSGTSGDASTVSVLGTVTPASGTDISGVNYLNGAAGATVPGYTPGDLPSELDLVVEATRCGGKFVYGWTFDKFYRDSDDVELAAGWIQARRAIGAWVSNSPLAWDAGYDQDVGPQLQVLGVYKNFIMWHDNADYYPEVSMLAYMTGINFSAKNSVATAKFKNLPGIPTTGITVPQYAVLNGKGYNMFTLTGDTARMTREGATVDANWWIDEVVILDNFAEELTSANFNTFLTNDSVGQDSTGVVTRMQPLATVCERYVTNGAFAPRDILDTTNPNGFFTAPAYALDSAPLAQQTVSDRASRVGTPISIEVYLRGSVHSNTINVFATA